MRGGWGGGDAAMAAAGRGGEVMGGDVRTCHVIVWPIPKASGSFLTLPACK